MKKRNFVIIELLLFFPPRPISGNFTGSPDPWSHQSNPVILRKESALLDSSLRIRRVIKGMVRAGE